ncbi:hypothetical protein JCM1841_004176 [Sporobolomyces salmonicolor]
MPRVSKAAEGEEPLSRQSLKAAVWYTVTKIAQEEELSLPFAASEHFVASLAEVVFQQALSLGKDLEAYAKHAGRLTINVDDVKLAARRNEPLYDLLCTSATTHGLALADLKADRKPKLKAPPRAAAKATTSSTSSSKAASAEKERERERERDESAANTAQAKKSKAVSVPVRDAAAKAKAPGGFIRAKEVALRKENGKGKKRKAVSDDEEEDEGGDQSGVDARVSDAEEEEEEEEEEEGHSDVELASDESEGVGTKRKGRGAKGKRGG